VKPLRIYVLTIAVIVLYSVSLVVLGQTSRPKPKPRPTPSKANKPFDTRCGVHYKNMDEFLDEIFRDWFDIGSSKATRYFYSPKRALCEDDGTLKVWIKTVEKDTNKKHSYSMIRYALNCRTDKMRVLTGTDYDKDGQVLSTEDDSETKWRDVVPESIGEMILETACRKSLN
jgi:hypothetical protein